MFFAYWSGRMNGPFIDAVLLESPQSQIQSHTAHAAMEVLDSGALSNRALLNRRFTLARRALTLSRFAGTGSSAEHHAVCLDLQACEAECRRRGLISS